MATEAAPPPSLEAQQREEYIDYSEDDSAAPAVATKDSNNNSFSSNAQFDADLLENTELLPSESDHRAQAVDVQVDADIAGISVFADAGLNGDGADFVSVVDAESAHQIDGTETEGGYFEETENLSATNNTEAEGAYMNENEISWEDGPSNEQDTDQDNSHAKLDHDDWQLVDEAVHIVQDATNLDEGSFEQAEVESHEIKQALEDPPNAFRHLDTDLEATAVVDVEPASEGQQAAGTQDSEAEEDVNEMDYPQNENGDSAADASADVSDAQLERLDAVQEGLGNAPSEQDAEDHTIMEDEESQLGQEVENNIADDDVNDEQHNGEVTNVPDYAAPGEATLDHEHVEYDDELLADARSSISAETPSNDNTDIPVITVSYKGIDYPFFYGSPDSEGKECFFNDLSLLHCKMEGVLAGFRRELANELGPFDELVFQIDELGLEFAESSQPDVFSDITLGQIISVFDSLVKNQNPNASKPLYAYLSTRPNCKKRWLSLVDDAYNGKGLDEISFYFASRAQSEAPEIMDDEPDLIGEEDNADAAAWPQSPGESERDDKNDDETQGETAETNEEINEYDDVGDGTAEDDDGESQDAVNENSIQPEASAIQDLDAEATMVDNEGVLMDESTVAVDIDTVEAAGVVDMVEDQQPEHHGENAPEVDTSNPLVWDAEEADASNTVEDAQTFLEDEDLTHSLNQIVEGVEVNSADKVTPNTSATSTLNGDEEATYENELDLNADLPETEIGGTEVHAQDDELAEIDWREFPGQDDDVAQSPSISGKRQRSDVDDMLDDEAQKDVKRRRS
ncbi:conserved glutamic acid-rich protein [Colletotrichum incanum]|uniref:Conserved glutamic acid-rich protein n=1 Tax=Colletotrichum incanum TaxID=1573173 RepID=A0A167DFF9_COLIC|nr:conserved glutamic acid-rich protein [Colletotrichum incanum]OHW90884.1 conserved glutamic acid-rich protein [Colletotrichum incanum]